MASLTLPTRRDDWRRMARTTRRVLGQPRWLLVALLGALATVTGFAALNTPVYVRTVVLGGDLSLWGRLRALAPLYPVLGTEGKPVRTVVLYVTALAVGTNLALFLSHVRSDAVGLQESSGSLVGVVLGTLGAGCVPCGLAVLASLLSLTGVAAGLSALPFEGLEFLLLALLVVVVSIHWLVDGMRGADVEGCPVDP